MADQWEVVTGNKRPKKVNGVGPPKSPPTTVPGAASSPKNEKSSKGKYRGKSRKTPAPFPLNDDDENEEPMAGVTAQVPPKKEGKSSTTEKTKTKSKTSGKSTKQNKPIDLEGALKIISPEELYQFFQELKSAGDEGDVHLSWIKYTASTLNTKINQIPLTPVNLWPYDLDTPKLSKYLQDQIRRIIKETGAVRGLGIETINIAFSSLLSSIPTLLLRGDPGWGYLIFLREMTRMYPQLANNRKAFSELMESYGNKKEIGLAILWVVGHAAKNSNFNLFLKLALSNLIPFFTFKNYKALVSISLEQALSQYTEMGAGPDIVNVEPGDFEEFFEASFDPKKRHEFQKFYPRVKDITLRNLKGEGSGFFLIFFRKISSKDFNAASPYGKEVLAFLHGCLENDTSSVEAWRELVGKNSKESIILLNYLAKTVETIKCQKVLEKNFIQSDEFLSAAVKTPELLRSAKKLQAGIKRSEAKKRKFSWLMASLILLFTIVGILWLDVQENGQGTFEKSNTGQFLKKYQQYDNVMFATNATVTFARSAYDVSAKLFRNGYEGISPVLQTINKQIQIYIPTVTKYLSMAGAYASDAIFKLSDFMTENVFVGVLSPENLRKMTKESLTFVWTNVYNYGQKGLEFIQGYVEAYYSSSEKQK